MDAQRKMMHGIHSAAMTAWPMQKHFNPDLPQQGRAAGHGAFRGDIYMDFESSSLHQNENIYH